jgi:hypothetical protein
MGGRTQHKIFEHEVMVELWLARGCGTSECCRGGGRLAHTFLSDEKALLWEANGEAQGRSWNGGTQVSSRDGGGGVSHDGSILWIGCRGEEMGIEALPTGPEQWARLSFKMDREFDIQH